MSDTPRTDAFEGTYFRTSTSHVDDVFDFARALERENIAIVKAHDAAVLAFRRVDADNARLREERTAAVVNQSRLRHLSEHWNPLKDFRNDDIGKWIVIGDHNRMIDAIDAARAALAEGGETP